MSSKKVKQELFLEELYMDEIGYTLDTFTSAADQDSPSISPTKVTMHTSPNVAYVSPAHDLSYEQTTISVQNSDTIRNVPNQNGVFDIRLTIGLAAGVGGLLLIVLLLLLCYLCLRKRKNINLEKNNKAVKNGKKNRQNSPTMQYSKMTKSEHVSMSPSSGQQVEAIENSTVAFHAKDNEAYDNGIVQIKQINETNIEDTKL